VPAPAVIPALMAYVKVVAVKTLVVGIRSSETQSRDPDSLSCEGHAGRQGRVGGGQVHLWRPALLVTGPGLDSSSLHCLATGVTYHD
jgi:hypothetical protein